jgi:hypothetical protein
MEILACTYGTEVVVGNEDAWTVHAPLTGLLVIYAANALNLLITAIRNVILWLVKVDSYIIA